ncbi:kinase-like domain-containing protein [Mycena amicta]|nr:kinase-like domain-containing protein [Mycena amicta]
MSSAADELRFIPSRLDDVESAEEYRRGGLHPILIGDKFAEGRYKILHKLGFGGSSTIWLARDQHKHSADWSLSKLCSPNDMAEICIPKLLQTVFPASDVFQTVEDYFRVHGPNGKHQFLISAPGRHPGSRRLRADLARRAIHHMHTAGLVHGGKPSPAFKITNRWQSCRPDDKICRNGQTRRFTQLAAGYLGCVENAKLTRDAASFLEDRVLMIDFGQSYAAANPPKCYQPGTRNNYCPPETRFEGRAGLEADVWTLACAIFEIRSGSALFDPFLGSDNDIVKQNVEVLGRLPDPWWHSFADRALWFEEDGEPKSAEAQALLWSPASKSSIHERLRSIGTRDVPPDSPEGPMMEMPGVRLLEEEVELLGNLLEKMLRYRPEERIGMEDVVRHPWFHYAGK